MGIHLEPCEILDRREPGIDYGTKRLVVIRNKDKSISIDWFYGANHWIGQGEYKYCGGHYSLWYKNQYFELTDAYLADFMRPEGYIQPKLNNEWIEEVIEIANNGSIFRKLPVKIPNFRYKRGYTAIFN